MLNDSQFSRYQNVIDFVTRKVFRSTYRGEYDGPEEIYALALDIASERIGLWDSGRYPPGRDLEIHALKAIDKDRYARGWTRPRDDNGRQYWKRPAHRTIPCGSVIEAFGDWPDESAEEDVFRSLMLDWPEFTRGQRRSFARLMRARYPEACAAFELIDEEIKPPKRSWDRWDQDKEIKRARLRVAYAQELAEVRFAVTYGMAA